MTDVLGDYTRFDAFNEAYEVVKTVELVGYDRNIYRIEVLKSYLNPKCPFKVDYYAKGFGDSMFKYPNGEEIIDTMKDAWVRLSDMPWVCGETAESALHEALVFLSERAKHRRD